MGETGPPLTICHSLRLWLAALLSRPEPDPTVVLHLSKQIMGPVLPVIRKPTPTENHMQTTSNATAPSVFSCPQSCHHTTRLTLPCRCPLRQICWLSGAHADE